MFKNNLRLKGALEQRNSDMQEIREEKVKVPLCQQAFNGGTKMRKPTLRKKVRQGTELVSARREKIFSERTFPPVSAG